MLSPRHNGIPRLFILLACLSAANTPAQNATHRLIVTYNNGVIPADAETRAAHASAHIQHLHNRLGMAVVTGTAATEQALRNDPTVTSVVEDRLIAASTLTVHGPLPLPVPARFPLKPIVSLLTTDALYQSPQGWAVRAVGGYGGNIASSAASGPWATTTGTGVRIAILDSGVDANHPDLAPNLIANLSEIDHTAQPSPCDDGSPQDQTGHGTWVASLAAAAAGPLTGQVAGVAPSASLINIKVLQRMPGAGSTTATQCAAGQASGLISWVLQGIDDALNQNADIIVLSLSLTLDLTNGADAGTKAAFDRATHAAFAAGAIVIAAAGNDAFDLTNPRYVEVPAMSRDVLAVVASTNPACAENLAANATCAPGTPTLAYYSNYGAPLNAVAAPGGSYPEGADPNGTSGWVRGACSSGLPSTIDGPPTDANHSEGCFNLGHTAYVQAIGTSAAAPLVAGVAALIRAAHPTWDAATVIAAIRASAVGPTIGVVNAATALAYRP